MQIKHVAEKSIDMLIYADRFRENSFQNRNIKSAVDSLKANICTQSHKVLFKWKDFCKENTELNLKKPLLFLNWTKTPSCLSPISMSFLLLPAVRFLSESQQIESQQKKKYPRHFSFQLTHVSNACGGSFNSKAAQSNSIHVTLQHNLDSSSQQSGSFICLMFNFFSTFVQQPANKSQLIY
jgi:hypothetical protein